MYEYRLIIILLLIYKQQSTNGNLFTSFTGHDKQQAGRGCIQGIKRKGKVLY
jgi:hypothetical protein